MTSLTIISYNLERKRSQHGEKSMQMNREPGSTTIYSSNLIQTLFGSTLITNSADQSEISFKFLPCLIVNTLCVDVKAVSSFAALIGHGEDPQWSRGFFGLNNPSRS